MRKWASAVFAAVALCGWAGKAQASPVVIDFAINGPSTFYPATGSVILNRIGTTYSVLDFALKLGPYDIDRTDFSRVTVDTVAQQGFSGLDIGSDPSGRNAIGLSFTPGYLGSFYYEPADPNAFRIACGACVTATLVSGYVPSVVPLPSAAPLFGAALLALGGAGWARRRARAPQAA